LRLKWPPSPIVAAQIEATADELAISAPASQLDRGQLDPQTPPAAIDQNAEGVPLPRARPPLSAQDTRGGRQNRALR
jgi:hypothetical protein